MHGIRHALCGLTALAALVTASIAAELNVATGEWQSWRGPHRDAICTETGLLKHWDENGPPLAWRIDGIGKGFSSVTIADGKIFTMGERDGGTFLIALDAQDGAELWATPVAGDDPNCTPTVDGDLVYALGKGGELLCAQAATGHEVWRKDFQKDFGGKMMSHWGYSESPLVDGDRLIVTPGAPDAMLAALDKKSGDVIWQTEVPSKIGNGGAGYSSVVVSEAAGTRQYVQLVGNGLISVAADDGRFLWSYEKIANGTANIPTPIVDGDYVFCSSGYGTGAALLQVVRSGNKLTAKQVYFLNAKTMQNHHGGMVLLDGYIYCGHGHNQGFPLCIEMKTGNVKWRVPRGPGEKSAAVLYADGNLYFRYENGVMALIEANPEKYVLNGKFKIPANNGPSWPHPVIAGKKLYLRDGPELLCYDIAAN